MRSEQDYRPGEPRGGRQARREAIRQRQRRRRVISVMVLGAVCFVIGGIVAWTVFVRSASNAASAPNRTTAPTKVNQHKKHRLKLAPSHTTTTTETATAGSPPKTWTLANAPARLRIVKDLIPYGPKRRAEMATYAAHHYGVASSVLHPKVIVLHFTASSTYASAHSLFSEDVPNLGELPGTCSHYIIDQDGTIYEQVPPTIMCRHTIGLNDTAIGIEMVQETGKGATWADQQILDRPAQINAALTLVKWLQAIYDIPTSSVIGHATANEYPLFHDNEGWRNDHTDWGAADVAAFRARLKAVRLR